MNIRKKILGRALFLLFAYSASAQYVVNSGELNQEGALELAKQAMTALGIEPDIAPIRGGTDGSKISFMGLPTPNLFAGGENFHGRYEFVSVDAMEKATDVIVKIIELAATND